MDKDRISRKEIADLWYFSQGYPIHNMDINRVKSIVCKLFDELDDRDAEAADRERLAYLEAYQRGFNVGAKSMVRVCPDGWPEDSWFGYRYRGEVG